MARIVVQPRTDIRIMGQQSFPLKIYNGEVDDKGELVVIWDGEKEPITFDGKSAEFDLEDKNAKKRKLAEAYKQIAGLNGTDNGGTLCGFVLKGHPSQIYDVFIPEEKAKADLDVRRIKLDYQKKVAALTDAQLSRYGVILKLGNDPTIIQTALFEMLDTADSARLVSYLTMDEGMMDVQSVVTIALQNAVGDSKFGVRKENGFVFFGDTPIGKDVETAATWILAQPNKTEILRALKNEPTSQETEKGKNAKK